MSACVLVVCCVLPLWAQLRPAVVRSQIQLHNSVLLLEALWIPFIINGSTEGTHEASVDSPLNLYELLVKEELIL